MAVMVAAVPKMTLVPDPDDSEKDSAVKSRVGLYVSYRAFGVSQHY
jgi:hypothetical protein